MSTKNKMKEKKAGDRKRHTAVFLSAVLLLLLCVGGWFVYNSQKDRFNDQDFYDPMAVNGILPGMSEAEIQEELNRVVEEGMLNISIASDIPFQDGKSRGRANISNSEANRYVVKVAITLDETGESIYESGGIRPGQYIQDIELSKVLEAGDYDATAAFTAYTQDTLQIVGTAEAQIHLQVKK